MELGLGLRQGGGAVSPTPALSEDSPLVCRREPPATVRTGRRALPPHSTAMAHRAAAASGVRHRAAVNRFMPTGHETSASCDVGSC